MIKNICENRVIRHEYFILETYEAGISLTGGEVKSIRLGSVNLKDSFCIYVDGEILIKNMYIALYEKSTSFAIKEAKRDRKLLLHKEEIRKLKSKIEQKGLTLVPLKLYFKDALIKMELALCQGKHTFDKKRSIMEKDIKRESERAVKNFKER